MKRVGYTLALTTLVVLSGCASVRPVDKGDGLVLSPVAEAEALRQFEAHVDQWYGTPHADRDPDGVDCSAYVQRAYADALGVALPRTTRQQVREGVQVSKSELRAGDLVFFRPTAKTRHVGIYLDNGRFAHASSSQGVMVSELGQTYWRSRYWTARRILARADLPAPSASAPDPPATRTPARHPNAGW
ncbi:MAG: NlpC/P60 family protein [Bacteroidota bacterium]